MVQLERRLSALGLRGEEQRLDVAARIAVIAWLPYQLHEEGLKEASMRSDGLKNPVALQIMRHLDAERRQHFPVLAQVDVVVGGRCRWWRLVLNLVEYRS